MSKERTVKPFRLAAGVVRDNDNAQPGEPRPQFVPNDHPRLAPPGMSGVRPAKRFDLRLPSQPDAKVGRVKLAKEFHCLVRRPSRDGHER